MKIPFDPTRGNGQFTRAGIAWFAQHLFSQGAAEWSDQINESLDAYIEPRHG